MKEKRRKVVRTRTKDKEKEQNIDKGSEIEEYKTKQKKKKDGRNRIKKTDKTRTDLREDRKTGPRRHETGEREGVERVVGTVGPLGRRTPTSFVEGERRN